jgi:hypothetical protein
MAEKSLSVNFNVAEISKATKRKPAYIKIAFSYPRYFFNATKEANEFVDKLMAQTMGGDIKIKNLRLVWDEE